MNGDIKKFQISKRFFNHFLFIFSVFLLLIIANSHLVIHMPPVWDAASGVFAPSIFLFENNLDYNALLRQDGYLSGGPNVHRYSLISLMTYSVISFLNGRPELFLPSLHYIQFTLSSIVLTSGYYIASKLMGYYVAFVISIALLLYPLFLVQTGYLYMEIPGAALFTSSVLAWAHKRYLGAIILSAVACMVKSFGIVLVFTLILLFIVDRSLSKFSKLIWVILVIALMITIETIKWSSITTGVPFDRNHYFSYILSVFSYLNVAPDLKILVITSLVIPIIFLLRNHTFTPKAIINVISDFVSGSTKQRFLIATYLLPLVFIGFIVTIPLSGKSIFPLLRYYVWVLPFMFIGSSYAIKLFLESISKHFPDFTYNDSNIVTPVLLVVLSVFFTINRDGRYYPDLGVSINSFSAVERSYEYLNFFNIQHDSVVSLVELQNGLPAFVTRGEYYYLSSPLMGYINKKVKNIFLVVKEPYNRANLGDYPEEFLVLDIPTNPFHGGAIVKNVLTSARSHPAYTVTVLKLLQRGGYSSVIYRVRKTKVPN